MTFRHFQPAWDDRQTRRAILIRKVHPARFDGAYEPVYWQGQTCGLPVECGSTCVHAVGHVGPCECGADLPNQPGTCPA